MPHADVNGQKLFYEDTGTGDDVIVFSHGLFMDHTMFDAQVALPAGPLALRRAGTNGATGGRRRPPHRSPTGTRAPTSSRLLDHLGVQRAVLAGMSQGGYLSLRAALTAPDRVRALVLMDTQPGPEDAEKAVGYHGLIDAWTAPGGPPQEVLDTVAQIILGPGWSGTPAWQERWRELPMDRVRQVFQTLVGREDDVAGRIAELTMPALVVHGSDDLAIDVEIARAFAQALPDAELVVVDGAGHAANLTDPDPVNAALGPFLERV